MGTSGASGCLGGGDAQLCSSRPAVMRTVVLMLILQKDMPIFPLPVYWQGRRIRASAGQSKP
jgi:hypothetical protein